jgi:hypothetical protein
VIASIQQLLKIVHSIVPEEVLVELQVEKDFLGWAMDIATTRTTIVDVDGMVEIVVAVYLLHIAKFVSA